MASQFTLTVHSPLDGQDISIGSHRLAEAGEFQLVLLAAPLDQSAKFGARLEEAFGGTRPTIGRIVASDGPGIWLFALRRDQIYVLSFNESGQSGGAAGTRSQPHLNFDKLATVMDDAGYMVDQSDAFVALRLTGPAWREIMARGCRIDLDDTAFPVGSACRTQMEDFGVIILRMADDELLLMGSRASAADFFEMFAQSMRYLRQ